MKDFKYKGFFVEIYYTEVTIWFPNGKYYLWCDYINEARAYSTAIEIIDEHINTFGPQIQE